MGKPIVAILGRPNVGKSTLFNRLTGGRVAIVEDTPGVTRDRLYRDAEWGGRIFTLVDTGGLDFTDREESLGGRVRQQVQIALEEADLLLFIVDARTGLTAQDELIANLLRKTQKPVLLIVNKVEQFKNNLEFYEFYQLGLGEPLPISAAHGLNTGDLLDLLVSQFKDSAEDEEELDLIKIAVVGRPNVGKSSLVNVILGEERVIVSDLPGTTRDAIDSLFQKEGQHYLLIDTAGMRRKGNIEENTERYSVIRALRAVDRSDLVLIVLDAVEGVTEQDQRIAGYVHEAGKGVIIVINKWDLVAKDEQTIERFREKIRTQLAFMTYAPMIFVSALTKQRVIKIIELVDFVADQQCHRVSTSVLNEVLSEAVQLTPPPSYKGKKLKVLYSTQAGVKPPHFILFVNDPNLLHFSYLRYLENKLRENFGFEGTPIRITIKKREA
ncbi:MAG: ribosome biogenesis GTPase Der [Clostridia bacterium]|nr:ribosome biogenesis GTPase Der [Clostridia bacterium]MDD4145943.1 ribosome biogenesis GTPase Der [Clostridia bacterium]MDD4665462.1 ribosome biogenesis GTPase Der [Clostridia bacterium]